MLNSRYLIPRIPCDPARPHLDNQESDCRATPGCFYDRSLGDYRKRFGHSIMPGVPVCHLAIRNSVFLEEARKVKTEVNAPASIYISDLRNYILYIDR